MAAGKGSFVIVIFLVILFFASPIQASVLTFRDCKATLGAMYELPHRSAFHPGETISVWVNVTNDQDYKDENLILKTESYRIDPRGNNSFLDKSEVFVPARENDYYGYDVIPLDAWNVSQNPLFGTYSYRIIYSVYRASDNSLLETSGVRYENLYTIEGGPAAPMPTILSIKVLDGSTPVAKARIYFDDRLIGQTYSTGTFNLQDPPVGKHSVKITRSGYDDYIYSADIRAGKTNSFALNLKKTNEEIGGSPAPGFTPRPIPGFDMSFAFISLFLTIYWKKHGQA